MEIPPEPSPFVISPPLIINCGTILWKGLPAKDNSTPFCVNPFSPVHKALKFSAASSALCPKRPTSKCPSSYPSIFIDNLTILVNFILWYKSAKVRFKRNNTDNALKKFIFLFLNIIIYLNYIFFKFI